MRMNCAPPGRIGGVRGHRSPRHRPAHRAIHRAGAAVAARRLPHRGGEDLRWTRPCAPGPAPPGARDTRAARAGVSILTYILRSVHSYGGLRPMAKCNRECTCNLLYRKRNSYTVCTVLGFFMDSPTTHHPCACPTVPPVAVPPTSIRVSSFIPSLFSHLTEVTESVSAPELRPHERARREHHASRDCPSVAREPRPSCEYCKTPSCCNFLCTQGAKWSFRVWR